MDTGQERGHALGATHGWSRVSIFFVLHYVFVDSACINIVTQDRGTRVPPVKSPCPFVDELCASVGARNWSMLLRLDLGRIGMLELDAKLD